MTEGQVTKIFRVTNPDEAVSLMGTQDKFLKILEEGLHVTLAAFGNEIKITGTSSDASKTYAVLANLLQLYTQGIKISSADVVSAMKMAQRDTLEHFQELYKTELIKDRRGKPIRVKNFGQRQYVTTVRQNDITFGVGPAGTGKTFLAVVMAVAALKNGEVEKIILTRPAVEAGESLGFLPGDLKEKVDPYLRPIYDALYEVLGAEHTTRLMDRGVIEIAPLAYMRGRTLDNAFVILDEAQNTTTAQMKMFLTRLGFGSKMIVNGDITQIDLPRNANSGLVQAQHVLKGISHIAFVEFSANDVVRHPVVASIIEAYERQEKVPKN
ncbi:PhoH family protein [Loigolactobacillus backii]|uniref:PhoH-like protein n=1 Tax=Loigolactobacillus backii TaxID=375175 RepID=A0A192H389_9LACO|nr:PhoH family protein [Loigolactobacillus backii]ANK59598.1 phosphate starvation-inducible protein PhoH [Loigolactobacillus backii]ANK62835.1 phosphate starvation-inducible protein PhoH [Loigolactobacillus backii]ANK64592.1 phosphate starvation-inducible protein PhoH [Loigolactobacillus backii]ANK67012.1 phosphate starvation-inducible protein PhoH [Loigolactobacillus backii]ANK70157.1 phosphate starvation-inducible protein PhoH [Loigolactobacillus backii]